MLALMPIYIVKAVHFHESESVAVSHSSQDGHSHSSDTCPICHFFLSPFVESPALHIVFFAPVVFVLVSIVCPEATKRSVGSASLRAPPAYVFC